MRRTIALATITLLAFPTIPVSLVSAAASAAPTGPRADWGNGYPGKADRHTRRHPTGDVTGDPAAASRQ